MTAVEKFQAGEKLTASDKLELVMHVLKFGKIEPKPASATTTSYVGKDGTTFMATPKMAEGNPVHVKTADGSTPCPDGEYELSDGNIMSCEGGLCTKLEAGADEYNQQWSDQQKLEFSICAEDRKKLADEGKAMEDGSLPIRNKTDLKHAIHASGSHPDPAKAKEFVKKRATEMEAEDMLPANFSTDKNDIEMKEQLEALETAFAAFKTENETLKEAVESVKTEFAAAKEELETLKSANEALKGENSAFETKFSALETTNKTLGELVEKLSKDGAEPPAAPVNTLFSVINNKDKELRSAEIADTLLRLKKQA